VFGFDLGLGFGFGFSSVRLHLSYREGGREGLVNVRSVDEVGR